MSMSLETSILEPAILFPASTLLTQLFLPREGPKHEREFAFMPRFRGNAGEGGTGLKV